MKNGVKQGISGFYPGAAVRGGGHFVPAHDGEYILYCRGKVLGGIYDDRVLVKPTKSALALMPDAERELPYQGAKEMLLVDRVDSREFMEELIAGLYADLLQPKKK